MLKIKEQFKGRRILKGNEVIVLDDTLTQKQLMRVQLHISDEFIEEEVPVEKVKIVQQKANKKKKKNNKFDDKDIKESE